MNTGPITNPPVPRKRWPKVILVLALIGAGLGFGGPIVIAKYAASTVDETVVSKINGDSKIEQVSFSWPARLEVGTWSIRDAAARRIASLTDVAVDLDAFAALRGRYAGTIDAATVELTVYEEEDGSLSTRRLPRETPEPSRESPKPKDLALSIRIPKLSLVLVAKDGTKSVFDRSSFEAELVSSEKPSTFKAEIAGAASGALRLDASLALFKNGVLDLGAVEGFVAAAVEKVALENLRALAGTLTPLDELGGTVDGSLRYELKSLTTIKGRTALAITGFRARGPALGKEPTAFKKITIDNDTELDESGTGTQTTAVGLDGFATLKSTGSFRDLARASGSYRAKVDLAADIAGLTRAAGGIIRIKKGVSLEGKLAFAADLVGKTVDRAASDVEAGIILNLTDLKGVDARGRPLPIDRSATFVAKGKSLGDGTLTLPEFSLKMGKLDAGGSFGMNLKSKTMLPSELRATADLGDLTERLSSFIEWPYPLGGTVRLETKVLAAAGATSAVGHVDLKGFEIAAIDGKSVGPLDARIDHAAEIDLRPGKRTTIDTLKLTSDIGTLSFQGSVTDAVDAARSITGSYTYDLDAAALERRLGAFFAGYSLSGGRLAGGGDVTKTPTASTLTLQLLAPALGIKGPNLVKNGIDMKSVDAQFTVTEAKSGLITIDPKVSAKSLRARDLSLGLDHWRFDAGALSSGGSIKLSPDGRVLMQLTTDLADVDVASQSPTGKSVAVKDPKIGIGIDGAYDRKEASLSLTKGEIASTFLRGSVSGDMSRMKTEPNFHGVRGDFTYVPEKLGAVLAPWLPGKLSGQVEQKSSFTLEGAASSTRLIDVLRHVDADAVAGLSTLSIVGFGLGGDAKLVVKDQRMTTDSSLTASGGVLKVVGDVDLRDDAAAKSRLKLGLADSNASAEMSPLLQLLNPIFSLGGQGTGGLIQGLLDFDVDLTYDAPIPPEALESGGWEALPKRPFNGKGRIAFSNLVVGGASIFGQLGGLLGLSGSEKMSLEPIDFTVKAGRVHYDRPLTMMVGSYALSWSGSIGLDKTLDMKLTVPVSEGIAGKNPMLRSVLGKSLSIPVGGTTAAPRLEIDKAIAGLVQTAATSAVEEAVGGKIGDVLGGILGGSPKEKDAQKILKDADKAFDEKRTADARTLYARLKKDFAKTDVYKKNKARIDVRSQ